MQFDYHRTVVAYHGTDRQTAARLVSGAAFDPSTNRDDWLGHGIYLWEYAPQQAWRWAERRHGDHGDKQPAVVGALVRLGRCLDLLDPANMQVLRAGYEELMEGLEEAGVEAPRNMNTHKFLDCAVFNAIHAKADMEDVGYDSTRAVFVPMRNGRLPRMWPRSAVFEGGHIQLCVRQPANILAVWSVKRDGTYGQDQQS